MSDIIIIIIKKYKKEICIVSDIGTTLIIKQDILLNYGFHFQFKFKFEFSTVLNALYYSLSFLTQKQISN